MKNLCISLTMLCFIQLDIIGQTVNIDYGLCNNCGGVNPAYTQGTYLTRHIRSDYGMRAVPNGTVFHMGIDLLPDGGAAGDAIAAVDTGTVIDLFMPAGIAAKKIVIESTGSAHRFAYLHAQFFELPPAFSAPEWLGWSVLFLLMLVTLYGLRPDRILSPSLRYRNVEPANRKPIEYLRDYPPMPPPPNAPLPRLGEPDSARGR